MRIQEIAETLNARVLCGSKEDLQQEIHAACGSDMMSDALAYVKEQAMLLTGLVNPQVVRTAEMLDMRCIVFVRGKVPGTETTLLAKERGIVLLSTSYPMFTACGKLYASGLQGGMECQ